MIPQWLTRYANENDLREIEAAVARAESHTSGEIVPMIVRESSFSGHVSQIITLFLFILFILATPHMSLPVLTPQWMQILVAAALSAVLGLLAARLSIVRRWFTPAQDLAQSVFHRAQLEFHETGIPATVGKTGVLIFVSLQERRAVILGDRAISEHIKPEMWLEVVNGLLKHMRDGELRLGFTSAIEKVGEVLAREFPATSHEVNELPNTLIVKD